MSVVSLKTLKKKKKTRICRKRTHLCTTTFKQWLFISLHGKLLNKSSGFCWVFLHLACTHPVAKRNERWSPFRKQSKRESIKLFNIWIQGAYFFKIEVHSMQGWTDTARHELQRKRCTKMLKHTEMSLERTYS